MSGKLGKNKFSSTLRQLMQTTNTFWIPNKYRCMIIKYIGGSVFRKLFFDRCYFVVHKLLEGLKKRDQFTPLLKNPVSEFHKRKNSPEELNTLLKDFPNIIISCSNLNYYDAQTFQSFRTLLLHKDGELVKDHLPVKTLLALFWSYKRLNRCDQELNRVMLKLLEHNISSFTYINYLRLLWMLSIDHSNYPADVINNMIKSFFEEKAKLPAYRYNAKNVCHVIQICFSLYPPLLRSIQFDKTTGNVKYTHLTYEKVLKELQEQQNPYLEHFEEMFGFYQKCHIIAAQNFQNGITVNDEAKQVAFVESNTDYASYYILKNKLVPSTSLFETHVMDLLARVPEIKFQPKVRLGIYEVDIVVGGDTLLEINGEMHYVRDSEELILNAKLKHQHLKEIGFKKVANLHFKNWDRLDNKDERRIELLKKSLENAIIL